MTKASKKICVPFVLEHPNFQNAVTEREIIFTVRSYYTLLHNLTFVSITIITAHI